MVLASGAQILFKKQNFVTQTELEANTTEHLAAVWLLSLLLLH